MTLVLTAVVVVALAAVACASVLARTRHAVAALLLWSAAGALLTGAALART